MQSESMSESSGEKADKSAQEYLVLLERGRGRGL
jgi:hypothetical protein